MKLGDMTLKQAVEICANHKYKCDGCPFHTNMTIINCLMLQYIPSHQDLNMEVNIDAENQS